MEDLNNGSRKPHKLMLTNRRTCTISGVNDVLSFDVNEILLETEQGMLMIKGNELHVSRLSLDKGRWISTGGSIVLPIQRTQGTVRKVNPYWPDCLNEISGEVMKYESGNHTGGYFFSTFCYHGSAHYICL